MSNVNEIIYTSDQLAGQHLKYYEGVLSDPGLQWGVPSVDKLVVPMRGAAGDLGVILGRPGDGKTSCLCYHAINQMRRIEEADEREEKAVVYVTWEGTVDKIYAAFCAAKNQRYSKTDYAWGRVPMEDVVASVRRGVMPVIMIGFSSLRQTMRKMITIDDVLEAIETVQRGDGVAKRKVVAAYLDYIQLIPVPRAPSKMERVSEAVIQAKTMGARLGIPILCGAQARRDVDSYSIKLARAGDAQHSSTIEQHVDFGYSVWRPHRTESGSTIDMWGKRVEVSPSLMVLRLWKQRDDVPALWWPLHMRPELLELAEMETQIDETITLGSVFDE